MARGHRHGLFTADEADSALSVGVWTRVILLGFVALAALGTVFGLVRLWPSDNNDLLKSLDVTAPGVTFPVGEVTKVTPFSCPAFSAPDIATGEQLNPDGTPVDSTDKQKELTCAHVEARVTGGAGEGEIAKVDVSNVVYDSGIAPGDLVKLARIPTQVDPSGTAAKPPPTGPTAKGDPPFVYSFLDLQRGHSMLILTILFALVVIVVARLRGLFALVGIGFAVVVLLTFILPALLDDKPGVLVGVVGASSIMLVVLYLTHGLSMRTTTAVVGTLLGTALTALLGAAAVTLVDLTGMSSDDTGLLASVAGAVNLQHLLTCGVILAGLGVLNDVTITQASAAWELRAADHEMSRFDLYRSAMRIGRDHIASTVYTIVFAYAGATLPVLLLIEVYQVRLRDVVVSEAIAEEVVRTLASGIGLVLVVPLTTAIAALATPMAQPGGRRVAGRKPSVVGATPADSDSLRSHA